MTAVIRPMAEADLSAILAIYNDAVANTTAIWNDRLSDLAGRRAWWLERTGAGFPIVVAAEGDAVLGYATFGPFRPHDGYRPTVEHSVYVAEAARGNGLGKALIAALFPLARAMGKRVMIGAVTEGNDASIRLHETLGFFEAARLKHIGEKFGRPLTLVLMQKNLS